jgi:hypothetical protein
MEKEITLANVDSKAYLLKHGKAGTKVKFTERKEVEIIKATKFYAVGDILNPHITWADELIESKIAKEYVAPKKK